MGIFSLPTMRAWLAMVAMAGAMEVRAAPDSLVYSDPAYSVVRGAAGNGEWIYTLSDKAAGTSIEVHQKGANVRKFTAKVRGLRFAVFPDQGNPKMMPWANRTAGGRFTDSRGMAHNLLQADASGRLMTLNDGLGNAIHGMVGDRPWEVDSGGIGADAEGVFLRCYLDSEKFPVIRGIFGAFRDYSVYRLKGNSLLIDSYVRNLSDRTFADCGWGYHTWLNLPVRPLDGPQQGSKARCALKLPADSVALQDGRKIPAGGLRSVATHQSGYFDFTRLRGLDARVDDYFTALRPEGSSGFSRAVYIDYGNRVRVQLLGQSPFYPWIVLYTPAQSYMAVEYQTQEVNALNTRKHLIAVPARTTSPVGRLVIAVDGDTTLAFQAPTSSDRFRLGHPRLQPRREDPVRPGLIPGPRRGGTGRFHALYAPDGRLRASPGDAF